MNSAVPRVVVVTLNWNGAEDTKNCVRSLLMMSYVNFDVIICDNDSRPESLASLRELGDEFPGTFLEISTEMEEFSSVPLLNRITLIRTGANLGYAGGMNVGMRHALSDPRTDLC